MKLCEVVQDHMVTHLLQLCKQEFGIDDLPPVEFVDDQSSVGDGMSFGIFDGDSIKVVTKNRHPLDVMRTLAHELVHWKQHMSGKELDGSDGSDDENQAHAVGGVIMRRFARQYPDYFVDTLP